MTLEKRLQEIKILKEKIAACSDDRVALDLQTRLIDLLKVLFEDKKSFVDLLNKK